MAAESLSSSADPIPQFDLHAQYAQIREEVRGAVQHVLDL
jgi:hypothetical protein